MISSRDVSAILTPSLYSVYQIRVLWQILPQVRKTYYVLWRPACFTKPSGLQLQPFCCHSLRLSSGYLDAYWQSGVVLTEPCFTWMLDAL